MEKTNRQQPEDISGKWAIVKGNALEVELRRRFRKLHPEYQVIDGTDISLVSKEHPLMHASLDGFVYDEASDSWGVLEIKTANANRGRTDWHDETGELIAPDYYLAQVTHYMAVTKAYPEPSEGIEDMSDSTDLRRLMADYQQTTADLNALKARKEELQDCILPYIGDHEGVRCGNMQATYKHSTRKGYTRVVQPWEGRTFRFSEIKPKKTK